MNHKGQVYSKTSEGKPILQDHLWKEDTDALGDSIQSLDYHSYKDVYDLNIPPDFLSGPGISLFKEVSSHALSAAVMSSSRYMWL